MPAGLAAPTPPRGQDGRSLPHAEALNPIIAGAIMSNVELPPPPPKPKFYELVVVHDHIAYVSGGVSRTADGVIGGYLLEEDEIEVAREAARVSMRRCLSALQAELGSLDRVDRVLSIRGFICAAPDFRRHPEVLDAASELLLEVLGDRGKHARSALGVSSIPGGGLTEIEMTVAIA
jgi:enamine deaminase RidA (YjgF/YER057c/UK114 family)